MIIEGLDILESLYAQYPTDNLPRGSDWLDHLDTLDAVRTSPPNISKLKPLTTFWGERMNGYTVPGFDHDKAQEISAKVVAQFSLVLPIVDHELRAGLQRLPVVNEGAFREAAFRVDGMTDAKLDRLMTMAKDDAGLGQMHADALNGFERAIDDRPTLAVIREWWDHIPTVFSIGGVGKVLARSNATRFDTAGLLPPLD